MVKSADLSADAFRDVKRNDRLLAGEILLRYTRTGGEINEAIEQVDLNCELSPAGQEIIRLHADEPMDGILGVVCYLILNP